MAAPCGRGEVLAGIGLHRMRSTASLPFAALPESITALCFLAAVLAFAEAVLGLGARLGPLPVPKVPGRYKTPEELNDDSSEY